MKKKKVVKHQKITINHKNRLMIKVNDFSAFLYMGRCKILSLLKLFP